MPERDISKFPSYLRGSTLIEAPKEVVGEKIKHLGSADEVFKKQASEVSSTLEYLEQSEDIDKWACVFCGHTGVPCSQNICPECKQGMRPESHFDMNQEGTQGYLRARANKRRIRGDRQFYPSPETILYPDIASGEEE